MTSKLDRARAIAEQLRAAGATHCLLVGGYVRDHLLGTESKDLDIEVYGLSYAQIAEALRRHHRVDLVGRSFGVVKVGNEIDISLPRSESKTGVGHTGFAVTVDPNLTPREAAARRDFTINAMAMDFDGKIFDPFGGREDLDRGLLRATSAAFQEDPHRVVRRLASRLSPSNIMMWSAVVEADASGRPPKPAYNPVARWVSVAESLAVTDERPTAIMMGRHLLPLGYEPGPGMGAILRAAFEAQLDGCFETAEDGTEWVVANYPVCHQQLLAPRRLK